MNPINSLQENASGFFEKVIQKYPAKMDCKKGCSKCCFTDITIFDVEADVIRNYFKNLEITDQSNLLKLWTEKNEIKACSFLYNDQCTIYNARPVICRTQGAPLFLPQENILDFCPLNFKDVDPPKEDWLNLERLNTLLAFAAKSSNRENRISLKKLKKELMAN
jgi:hypothetical protein